MKALSTENILLLYSMAVLATMVTGIARTQAQPTVTLIATPSVVAGGQTITVTWTAGGDTSYTDWIGLYEQGAPNTSYLAYKYTGGSASGSVTFSAPDTPGTYEFRYLPNGGYIDVATSNPVTVELTLAFTAQPQRIGIGMNSTLIWSTTGATECTASDGWSGTKPTAGEETVGPTTTTAYTLTADGPTGSVSKSVTVTVTGPVTLSASPSIVDGGQTISLTWTAGGDTSFTDWIGLYEQGAPNTSYLAYKYTGGSASGSVAFSAPESPGTYEFRYLLNGGYTNVATSNPVIVLRDLLSGMVWMDGESDFGYSLDENSFLYFYSSEPVLNYDITLGHWVEEGPDGWIFIDWPFYYIFDTGHLMFALPPESGLWVYYFSTDQWTRLPRIIP